MPWLIGDGGCGIPVQPGAQLSSAPTVRSAGPPASITSGHRRYKPTAIENNLVRAIFGPTAQRLEPFNKQLSDAIAGFAQGTFTLSPTPIDGHPLLVREAHVERQHVPV
jgi:hypothetical protein